MGIVVVPNLVALAPVGSNVYAVTTANSKLHVVDASNPAAMNQIAFYDLRASFLVAQFDPTAIVAREALNLIYVQNASEQLPHPMVFAVYDVTNPLAVIQRGTLSFGNNLFVAANKGNSLAINYPIVYSLLGGDITANPAQLRAINVSNPDAPAVVGAAQNVGTFSDQPRKLWLDGNTLYVLSGTPSTANQKVFVYDVTNPAAAPALLNTIPIGDASAQVGLANFFVKSGAMNFMAGTGLVGSTNNLVIYGTDGSFFGSALVSSGVSGLAIVPGS